MSSGTPVFDASASTRSGNHVAAGDDHAAATIRALERRIAQASLEIATLSEMLRLAEADAAEKAELNNWLRRLALLLLKPRAQRTSLRSLLGKGRAEELADTADLFDSAAYLRRYADVAAAKFDPLIHYLRHGMDEGRKR
ncbi:MULTISPECIES: hypothetical protein [Novosphingobium]|uniref:hypothetical protein n=1 Tax=Novosphingobium TaxID=165696 RepID=UPI00105EBA88|nr:MULTISPECIES: hypothetical protein [Novosphingobium]WQD94152.1 hypothetical protein U0041_06085 [Novosphingobium capsulatum]